MEGNRPRQSCSAVALAAAKHRHWAYDHIVADTHLPVQDWRIIQRYEGRRSRPFLVQSIGQDSEGEKSKLNFLRTGETGDQESIEPLAKAKKSSSSGSKSLVAPILPLLIVVGLMWLVWFVDWLPFPNLDLTQYGIHPRTIQGLFEIPIAPFIHADLAHLVANTIPLFILGYLIIIRDKRNFMLVFVVAMIVSGLGIWTFGATGTVHMGASGVVFGFMGYLLARAYFERSFVSILFGIIAVLLYGSILAGILPGQPGVSWLGHLFGLAGGVLAAWAAHRTKPKAASSGKKSKPKAASLRASAQDLDESEPG
jgi:membrane associated rhomboid family serine protease